jgi:hypothetical protein
MQVESAESDRGPWTEHARATVRPSTAGSAMGDSGCIRALLERCPVSLVPGSDRDVWHKQSRHLAFGPRWNVVREAHLGSGEVMARLALDTRFHGDLDNWQIHPALLDFATAWALAAVEDYEACTDVFVPFAYGRVIAGAVGDAVWTHARVRPNQASSATVVIDVRVYDEDGRLVASVDEFVMRRLVSESLTSRQAGKSPDGISRSEPLNARSLPLRLLEQGIRPLDGALALERVLQSDVGSQVVVSPVDLSAIEAAVATVYPGTRHTPTSESASMTRAQGSRVLLGEPEASLAAIWEEVLGVQEVGPDDDFFDLGGHSLLSMRVATRVQRRFGASVPLPVLFEARTVRQLAGLLRNAHPSDQGAVADDDLAAPVSAGPSLRAVSRDAFKVNRASMVTDD